MARAIWWAALLIGASYMIPILSGWDGSAIIAWKGAGVALLALWAAVETANHRLGLDGWLIAIVLAFGATGDVLLDAMGLETGAVAFVMGHLVAIWLYLRNRRVVLTISQRALAWVVVPASMIIVWAMLHPATGWWHAAVYTLFVAAMAATAWTSRFPRYRTGIGAMLFVVSDLVIFAREGAVIGPALGAMLIWPMYFGAQALIAWGVVTTLRDDARLRAGG